MCRSLYVAASCSIAPAPRRPVHSTAPSSGEATDETRARGLLCTLSPPRRRGPRRASRSSAAGGAGENGDAGGDAAKRAAYDGSASDKAPTLPRAGARPHSARAPPSCSGKEARCERSRSGERRAPPRASHDDQYALAAALRSAPALSARRSGEPYGAPPNALSSGRFAAASAARCAAAGAGDSVSCGCAAHSRTVRTPAG